MKRYYGFLIAAAMLWNGNWCYGDPVDAALSSTRDAGKQLKDSIIYRVELLDGQILVGKIVGEADSLVHLQLATGDVLALPRTSIRAIKQEHAMKNPDGATYRLTDPNRTRYLFSPSAFMMSAGQKSFSQEELLLSMFSAGLTDHFSIQVGSAVPFWFVSGGNGFNFLMAAKYGGQLAKQLNCAGGIWAFTVPAAGDGVTLGLPFLTVTVGDDNANLSINGSLPFGVSGGEFHSGDLYWLTISGIVRVADHLSLLSENWFFTNAWEDNVSAHTVWSFGVRFMGRNISADVALMFIEGAGMPLPWVNFTYAFGK